MVLHSSLYQMWLTFLYPSLCLPYAYRLYTVQELVCLWDSANLFLLCLNKWLLFSWHINATMYLWLSRNHYMYCCHCCINSLTPDRCRKFFKNIIFKICGKISWSTHMELLVSKCQLALGDSFIQHWLRLWLGVIKLWLSQSWTRSVLPYRISTESVSYNELRIRFLSSKSGAPFINKDWL